MINRITKAVVKLTSVVGVKLVDGTRAQGHGLVVVPDRRTFPRAHLVGGDW